MKKLSGFVIIILVVLAFSCTVRPTVVVKTDEKADEKTDEKIVVESLFDKALRTVKTNSQLINKHFEPPEVIVSGSGYKTVADISVNGQFQIDGNEFLVTYNLNGAALESENVVSIPFCLEQLGNGITYNDVLLWNPGDEDAGLLLSFDDHYWSSWRQYFDLFDSYGAKATFFVIGSVGVKGPSSPNGLSKAGNSDIENFCAEAVRRGQDLGFHTATHPHLPLVSTKRFYEETIEPARAFAKRGIYFSAFAYPFGFSQPWMRKALAPYFHVTRGYGLTIRFFDTSVNYNRYIVSTAIDNTLYPDQLKFEHDMLTILAAAKFTGHCIVPLASHIISAKAKWGIDPQRLEYLLKTAGELKLKFYTYSDYPALFPSDKGGTS